MRKVLSVILFIHPLPVALLVAGLLGVPNSGKDFYFRFVLLLFFFCVLCFWDLSFPQSRPRGNVEWIFSHNMFSPSNNSVCLRRLGGQYCGGKPHDREKLLLTTIYKSTQHSNGHAMQFAVQMNQSG